MTNCGPVWNDVDYMPCKDAFEDACAVGLHGLPEAQVYALAVVR